MTSRIIIISITSILLISSLAFFIYYKAERYKVTCNDYLFKNVKKSYRPGAKVKICFPYVATDTDYSFYLDDERISDYRYNNIKGYVITFIMPSHDVELTCNSRNSMENLFHIHKAGTILFTYREKVFSADEDNNLYSVTVEATEDESKHKMTVYNNGNKSLYSIPIFPYESCYNYINHEQLWKWNKLEEYECLDGKRITLSILLDKEYITISTDMMPEFGENILNYLHTIFADYMIEEYKK